MEGRSWARPVGEDAEARVTLEPAEGDVPDRYRVAFPFLVGDQSADDLQVTGDGRVTDHRIRSDDGRPVSDVAVSLPEGATLERLIVRSRPERIVVHLPSADLLAWCDRAIDGDGEAIDRLVEAFPSPVQLPLVCGSFLGLDATLGLVEAVVGRDRRAQSLLHSYRYAVVRAALVSRTGLHVPTYRDLSRLVRGLDAIAEIGDVALVDALGDAMATVHGSTADTDALVDRLGVEPASLHARDDGRLTACYLALIACSEGPEAATAYEVPRTLPPRGHYERRKRAVFRAAYGDRGTAWRRLLNAARRESEAEVGRVLAYTLYWTGEESRSDSRVAELLLRGAELAARHTGLHKVEHKARFKRLLAAGHRLRGTHCWGPSAANFAAARELASRHAFLPEWEPILAGGVVRSRALSLSGDHAAAAAEVDRTLEAYLEADPPTAVANESVRHLRAQKCELESLRWRDDDPERARALLAEARAHFEAIGFDRSREKVERMLASLPVAEVADEVGAAAGAVVGEAASVAEEGEPAEAEAPAGEAWLDDLEYPDEDALGEPYDERFEDPYPG